MISPALESWLGVLPNSPVCIYCTVITLWMIGNVPFFSLNITNHLGCKLIAQQIVNRNNVLLMLCIFIFKSFNRWMCKSADLNWWKSSNYSTPSVFILKTIHQAHGMSFVLLAWWVYTVSQRSTVYGCYGNSIVVANSETSQTLQEVYK